MPVSGRATACGRENAPPLFETIVVLGRDVRIHRIHQAFTKPESFGAMA
jgi:hypothetical protein